MKWNCWIVLLLLPWLSGAQTSTKKPLDHSVYDSWKSIPEKVVSDDGRFLAYSITPQEGDALLVLYDVNAEKEITTMPRGVKAQMSHDSRFVVFHINPRFAETRQAKIKKKKEDDMPKDSLGIYDLADQAVVKYARIKNYKLPEKGAGWVAIHFEKEPTQAKSKTDSAKKDLWRDAENDEQKKKDELGSRLTLRRLVDGKEETFELVSEYLFSKDGKRLVFAGTGNDSTIKAGVFLYDTENQVLQTLKQGKGKYRQLVFDELGAQCAFLADLDTSKAKQRYYSLFHWNEKQDSAKVVADTSSVGLPRGWLVSENGNLLFSKNGKRLFFGTAPRPVPVDTTIVEFEVAKVDIWSWKDPYLQPQQLKQLEKELKKSYVALLDLASKRMTQLADLEMPELELGGEGNADYAFGTSNLPYRQALSWDGVAYNDVFIVSLKDGGRRMIVEKLRGPVNISPQGKYLFWFDDSLGHWFVCDTKSAQITNLTSNLPVALADELNDQPDLPGAYGYMGWTKDDRELLVYDRYDIWKLDPSGKTTPKNITLSRGRENKITYRYVKLDPEERFIDPSASLLLRIFDETDKSSGFSRLHLTGNAGPTLLLKDAFWFSPPIKAKDAERYLFSGESFRESPDVWISDGQFKKMQKISDANPQQKEFLWGSVELVSWNSTDGKALQGLLYKPENFDPTQKYPMLVYFYERNSDRLHRYDEPTPTRSIIRPSFYVSRGYLFFVPDIVYDTGFPGESAVKCVLPGVLKLIDQGFVDEKHIGVQGQSWGGYQTAYMVTRTNLFCAAGAGAPVSNMTSAYGGIRWESGMSRMFQYEHSQSRIGGTLWEKPLLYIENSPLFRAPDVQTPLLIMANDNDGAVPWYQGIELFVALRRLGKPAWLLNYNGEAHNLEKRQNRKDLQNRLQQFFDHYLLDAPEPVWMKEGVPATLKGKNWGFEPAQ